MPRKRVVARRDMTPDPKYNSLLVAKFVNNLMKKGKKSLAESILYGAFDIIEDRTKEEPLSVFKKAVGNVKPRVEVKSRRVGGSTYLSFRWIISFAKARSEKTMEAKLAGELLDAANKRGAAIKKREDTHRMADANKAFAHYRW